MPLAAELKDHRILQKLQAFRPQSVASASLLRGELTLEIPREYIRAVCELLKQDPELQFDSLVDLTCIDRYPVEPRFEVVYHLLSLTTRERLRLKTRLTSENPRLDSITGLWGGANWLEREIFDLFGVHFTDHPNLRRLLMPDDWQGHPLRKDYPLEGPR